MKTDKPKPNDWEAGAPITLQKRLLYGVCGILPGGLLYILIALGSGANLAKSDLLPVVLFGFVLGLLFPKTMRTAFIYVGRRAYHPDSHKINDDELLHTVAMTIVISFVLIAFF